MTIEVINVGSAPNDGTGDSLRKSFIITNNNFSYLYGIVADSNITVANTLTLSNTLSVAGNVYIGEALSFVPLNANLQYASTANSYVQLIMQNKSSLTNASTDFVATADNGTDSTTYINMGINSSGYNQPLYNLSAANDGYIIVAGNTTTNGGKLVISTLSNNDIVFSTNGATISNEIARFTHGTGLQISATTATNGSVSGALQVAGGASVEGNLYVGGTITGANTITATANITAPAFESNAVYMSTSASGIYGTGSGFGLDLVRVIRYNVGNQFGTNVTTISANLNASAASRSRLAFDINANVTVTFGGTIVAGVEKQLAIRNLAATTQYVIMPNANNNKGSNTIPIASNTIAFITSTSLDDTSANVISLVTND